MEIKDKVIEILKENNIDFEVFNHEAFVSMDQYEVIEGKIGCKIPKNLFLCNRQETVFYLLIMPGDKIFKTKDISAQINSSRLSFGNKDYLNKLLSCYKGSTSVLGLLFDKENRVNLLIDEDILKEEYLGFHPCDNNFTIKIKKEDLISKIIPLTKHDYKIVNLPKY